jgi:hypothetical protein
MAKLKKDGTPKKTGGKRVGAGRNTTDRLDRRTKFYIAKEKYYQIGWDKSKINQIAREALERAYEEESTSTNVLEGFVPPTTS